MPPFVDGSRTLKAGGNFPYIGERRGVIFIKGEIKRLVQFARHKNNTEGLRAQVRRTITAFLLTQMNNGAFRSREPAKAFFVDVSETLNTPSVTCSTRFGAPMPHFSFASTAARVVTAPFGPTTVSLRSDGLCQEVAAGCVAWAWAASQGTNSRPQTAASGELRPIFIPVPLRSVPVQQTGGPQSPRFPDERICKAGRCSCEARSVG
jgi:hypothetical protein